MVKIGILNGGNMKEKFSIIEINLEKLSNKIDEYICKTEETNPFIFINENTLNAVELKSM